MLVEEGVEVWGEHGVVEEWTRYGGGGERNGWVGAGGGEVVGKVIVNWTWGA